MSGRPWWSGRAAEIRAEWRTFWPLLHESRAAAEACPACNPPEPVSAGHEVRITDADERGTPTAAECSTCGRRWARPDDDEAAATLAVWARIHMDTP